jgi:MOSC domain-containing protein YiiM
MSEIIAVNISGGGIPKAPIPVGRVVEGGLEGDAHDHDKHDTPMQAISIIADEVLDALRAEGFDVGPGSTGENLTVRGLDVDALEPGMTLRFSGGVQLECTKKRQPCFVLDAIHADLQEAIRDRCGAYAKVIVGGEVRPGETIELD